VTRALRIAAAVALCAVLLLPELLRYRAERELRRLTTIVLLALSGRVQGPQVGALLADTSRKLEGLGSAMPGDVRPAMYAASTALVTGDRARAVELYVNALGHGERGELDVNLGRAFEAMEDSRAEAMFVRAVWVSPGLIDAVPETYRGRVRHTIARRLAGEGGFAPPGLPVLPATSEERD
jgi:hypothetical protein